MNATTTLRKLSLLAMASGLGLACFSTRPAGDRVDDAWITTKIESKLVADPQVSAFNVDVDTLDGVVTLRGEVEREVARTEAEELARETEGVVAVRNEIRVVSPATATDEPLSDSWITSKIKAKYLVDPELNPFNIDVDTIGGRVTLSGRVSDAAARAEAEQLARDTEGVITVDNQLEVGGS